MKKFKIDELFDAEKVLPTYGIVGKIDGKEYRIAEENKPLLYYSKEECKKKIKELNE